ncbi:bZIP transcription factor [Nesidiocoris tenuis]|uniref:BZIP transcription factor n=1 Tax=Nesidiocoris tenuis TaxID=355587 RepID=A0ABN7AGG5_9HEMI|nr:bZIP transcription factor [Nesidiocoris tenuis]
MMVAEFIERQNASSMDSEAALHSSNNNNNGPGNFHSSVTSNNNNGHGNNNNGSNNNNNNNNNGTNGCGISYCSSIVPELNMELNMMASRGDSNDSTEHDGSMQGGYPSNYDMNHMQRKDLFSQRKQREFIPDNKKDESYWDRRRRNNEAAKRSREKRRYNDMILEQRVVELSKENHFLKAQLTAIKDKFGISGESVVNVEQVMATLPSNDQVLSITKRAKMAAAGASPMALYAQGGPVSLSVPIPTPVIHRTAVGANGGPSPPLVVPLHVYQSPSSVESNGEPPSAYLPEPPASAAQVSSAERYPPFPFAPVLPPLNPPVLETSATNSVLNLSRSRSPQQVVGAPYDLHHSHHNASLHHHHALHHSVVAEPPMTVGPSSCLPHKLRHKSHLGDKDVAATALLSLHNIKQEPGSRASPPWDGEGSSDERDSGISLGAEWLTTTPPNNHGADSQHSPSSSSQHDCIEGEPEDDDATHIKSEVARLASEVASLKSLLSRKKAVPIPTN